MPLSVQGVQHVTRMDCLHAIILTPPKKQRITTVFSSKKYFSHYLSGVAIMCYFRPILTVSTSVIVKLTRSVFQNRGVQATCLNRCEIRSGCGVCALGHTIGTRAKHKHPTLATLSCFGESRSLFLSRVAPLIRLLAGVVVAGGRTRRNISTMDSGCRNREGK